MGTWILAGGKNRARRVVLALCFLITGIIGSPFGSAWGQNFSPPTLKKLATEHLATKSGILVANARTGECVLEGKAKQKLQVHLNGKVVATEESSGPQRALSITHPVPKDSLYRITTSCPSAFATAYFIESEQSPELFKSSEIIPFNSSILFPQHGIVVANAGAGTCVDTSISEPSPPGSNPSQRLSFRNALMNPSQFIEERDNGESHSFSLTAPLLGSTASVFELECDGDSRQNHASFFPFNGAKGIIKAPQEMELGLDFVPPSDGLLVVSARSGICISNNQILQRVSVIINGVTIADKQSYGSERSLSVTVPVQRGARVRPESACPLAEAHAFFFPIDVFAPVIIPECLDKKDNDGDGLIDSADPGCRIPTMSRENEGTSQCQDGIDNDGDGSSDYPSEFGCGSLQDNDESDVASQCQDRLDNDGDGLIDSNDKGCSSSQDNRESDEPIECNDTIDNDNDGLIDLLDPGCDSPQDRSEYNQESRVRMYTECIQENGDTTHTAYVTYNNTTPISLDYLTKLPSSVFQNVRPEKLLPGEHRGAIQLTFSGENSEIAVAPLGLPEIKLELSTSFKRCAPIIPSAECIDSNNSELLGTFGYNNLNPFDVILPAGNNNVILDSPNSFSLPTRFKTGRNAAAFTIPFKDKVVWVLQGIPVTLSLQSSTCAGGCVGTSTITTRSEVNAAALQLAGITVEATKFMRSQVKKLSSLSKKRLLQADIKRATSRAQSFLKEANSLMVQIPTVVKSCPNAAAICTKFSGNEIVEKIRALLLKQESATKRFISRAFFALGRGDSRRHPLVTRANKSVREGIISLSNIPLDTSVCG